MIAGGNHTTVKQGSNEQHRTMHALSAGTARKKRLLYPLVQEAVLAAVPLSFFAFYALGRSRTHFHASYLPVLTPDGTGSLKGSKFATLSAQRSIYQGYFTTVSPVLSSSEVKSKSLCLQLPFLMI